MANNRGDYFIDTVLGGTLGTINAVTLSKVFIDPDNWQDRVNPRISYHLTDDTKIYAAETRDIQQGSPQGFVLFAYSWVNEDTNEQGLLTTEANRVRDLVEKAFENRARPAPYIDTNGQIVVQWVKIDRVLPVMDYGPQTVVLEFQGTITYDKYPQ